jgi:hypothetical protein
VWCRLTGPWEALQAVRVSGGDPSPIALLPLSLAVLSPAEQEGYDDNSGEEDK